MPLNIESIETVEALAAIEPEWRELWRRDPAATPFQSPEWLLPWTRSLWGGGKLRVLAVRHGGDLVALAPFFLWGYGERPEVIRVSFLGAGITDYLGILAAPEFAPEAARQVFEGLLAMPDQWHICGLEELRPNSPLLLADLPPGLVARSGPSSVCPVLALPPSMEELYAQLQPKFRSNLRYAEARLRREGADFTMAGPDEADDVLSALFHLHTARWRERRLPGMLATAALQEFHREAAGRLIAQGLARLFALRLNGQIIAAQYDLRDGPRRTGGHRVYFYLSGFDPAYARYSPGAALLAWSIRSAIEEGAAQYDFLRKREDYKYQWGARDRVNRKLLISRSAFARDVA